MTPLEATLGVEADTWAAIESMATTAALLLGAAAAVYGWLQLRQGASARLDQNRPYVLLTLAPARLLGHLDFLVQNLGAGPAYDVRISVDPPLERSDEIEGLSIASAKFFNEPMPLMPPGYELRSYFDSLPDRNGRVCQSATPSQSATTTATGTTGPKRRCKTSGTWTTCCSVRSTRCTTLRPRSATSAAC